MFHPFHQIDCMLYLHSSTFGGRHRTKVCDLNLLPSWVGSLQRCEEDLECPNKWLSGGKNPKVRLLSKWFFGRLMYIIYSNKMGSKLLPLDIYGKRWVTMWYTVYPNIQCDMWSLIGDPHLLWPLTGKGGQEQVFSVANVFGICWVSLFGNYASRHDACSQKSWLSMVQLNCIFFTFYFNTLQQKKHTREISGPLTFTSLNLSMVSDYT